MSAPIPHTANQPSLGLLIHSWSPIPQSSTLRMPKSINNIPAAKWLRVFHSFHEPWHRMTTFEETKGRKMSMMLMVDMMLSSEKNNSRVAGTCIIGIIYPGNRPQWFTLAARRYETRQPGCFTETALWQRVGTRNTTCCPKVPQIYFS